MSMHDFSLLSPPSPHDHFPSAFLQGFPPSAFDSLSTTPLERLLHPDHHDRRMVDLPPPFMPRQPPARTYPFEYMNTPLSPSTAPFRRSVSGLDPRPHAGWTPKEEVDEDEHARELCASASGSGAPSPVETPTPGEKPAGPLRKMYSFISLPGNAVRKRPRRRYDEIERLYACAWPGCDKAYGTLNHLNAHVNMQRHGAKRSPAEFKELREQWRKQKKLEPLAGRRRRRSGGEPAAVPGAAPPAGGDDGPSPTSSAGDSATYWRDAPLSPLLLPPLPRLDAGSMLLQPLHTVTLAASLGRESPDARRYDEYGERPPSRSPGPHRHDGRRDEHRRRWS